jgi:guanylate kinase
MEAQTQSRRPRGGARPVLVIIGPSASGKSSVVRELHRRRVITVLPTWTTRPRRAEECGGSLEHRFVSDAVFDDLCARGLFLETAELPGSGLPYRYGLPRLPRETQPASGPVDALIVRAPFVAGTARLFPGQVVYQIEDTAERAHRRLVLRGCAPAELAARLDDHEGEIEAGRRAADRVIVNQRPLAALVDAVADAVRDDLGHPMARARAAANLEGPAS